MMKIRVNDIVIIIANTVVYHLSDLELSTLYTFSVLFIFHNPMRE